MEIDQRLIGDGPYPLNGVWAVLARMAFLGAICAILIAVFLPGNMVPHFVRSHYLQHFAAFYVATLFGLAAAPHSRLRSVTLGMLIFVTGLELSHLVAGAHLRPLVNNWVADVGGIVTAVAPALAERFRARLRSPTPASAAP